MRAFLMLLECIAQSLAFFARRVEMKFAAALAPTSTFWQMWKKREERAFLHKEERLLLCKRYRVDQIDECVWNDERTLSAQLRPKEEQRVLLL